MILQTPNHQPSSRLQVFLQYLLPVLSSAAVEADEHVCVAYANHLGSLAQVPYFLHFEPSLDALNLRSDAISPTKILSQVSTWAS